METNLQSYNELSLNQPKRDFKAKKVQLTQFYLKKIEKKTKIFQFKAYEDAKSKQKKRTIASIVALVIMVFLLIALAITLALIFGLPSKKKKINTKKHF